MTRAQGAKPAQPTIIDLLENALDGNLSPQSIERLSLQQIADVAEAVQEFYESWEPPVPDDGVLRVHLGGWVAGNLHHPGARTLLHSALLYAHEVLVHDPVAAYFEPRRRAIKGLPPIRHRSGMQVQGSQGHIESTGGWVNSPDLDGARSALAQAVEGLAPLAQLIRLGVAVPVPHLRAALGSQQAVLTAVRHSLRDESFRTAVESPVRRTPFPRPHGAPAVTRRRSESDLRAGCARTLARAYAFLV
jgi:hypothetical protein